MAENYVSNSELAARLSALVDRWNLREDELLALLTQETGNVTLTDAEGVTHSVPSYQQLQTTTAALTDDLTGAAASAAASAQDAAGYAMSANTSASAAAASATSANDFVSDAEAAAASASNSATTATTKAGEANTSATNAATSATNASNSATAASTSAGNAAGSATAASTSATNASTAKTAAEAARDKANSFANAAQGVEVEAGLYSAKHWASQAQAAVTGTLIYMGAWSAATAYPASPLKGHFYKVSTAGNATGVQYDVGDQILYNGSSWDKIDNTEAVLTVAGRTGNVTLSTTDVSGLSTALGAKADLAGGAFTGNVSVPRLQAGTWGFHSGSAAGDVLLANNAYYNSADNTFRYGRTHASIGASGIVCKGFSGAGPFFFDTGDNATTADAAFTPTLNQMWHAGNFDPTTKANLSTPIFNENISVKSTGNTWGYVQLNRGGPSNTGYVAFYNAADVRKGYMGYADATTIILSAEDGTYYNFTGTVPRIAGSPIFAQSDATETATGSKLVQRTSNGWIYAVHYNNSGPINTTRPTHVIVEINTDGFMRREPVANFKQHIGLWVQATDPGASAVDGDLWIN